MNCRGPAVPYRRTGLWVPAAPKVVRPFRNGFDGTVEAARSNGKPGLRLMLDERRDRNVMPFERSRVAEALLASWSLKTSEQWLAVNPACGQCSVTALLINELFGGQILK